MHEHPDRARMLICCPDQPGIVATVSQFLYAHGANIVHSDQHTTDPVGGSFFMRIEFDLPHLTEHLPHLQEAFTQVAQPHHMTWRIERAAHRKRIAIFVSKEDHCLFELLWRQRAGDLPAEIAMVIGNHDTLRDVVEAWGIPFHHIPVSKDNRAEAEAQHLALLKDLVDLVVLARYMQIISPSFLEQYPERVINIHHSFLPAFVGANPYLQAHQRGVKLIGATAHYVTADLDAGPIIEQDVRRVSHSHSVADMRRIGRLAEREVLARAVAWHCEDRILVSENKTVVFA